MNKNNNTAGQTLASSPAVKDIVKTSENDSINWLPLSSTKTEHKPGVYTYDFIPEQHRWIRLHYLTNQKAYSNSVFKDGHRSIENVTAVCNIIILDIDDGYTLAEVREILKKYHHLIVTTSSHQKDKRGVVCDRFRVLLVADENLPIDNDVHKRFMSLLAEGIGLDPEKLDKGCFNIAAAYKPASNQLHWYNDGTKVPVVKMISLAEELIKSEKIIKEYQPVKEYETDKQKVLDALDKIDPDIPYSDWFRVGAALKTEFGEEGFGYFDSWSSRGRGYNEMSVQQKWNHIAPGKIGAGTIIRMAS